MTIGLFDSPPILAVADAGIVRQLAGALFWWVEYLKRACVLSKPLKQ
jgi:hypothetical protein